MPKRDGIGVPAPPGRKVRGSHVWVWLFIAVICGFAAWAVYAVVSLQQEEPPRAVGATVGQIADHPDDFYGRVVVLTTVVHRVLGPHSFTAGNGELLVVARLPLPKLAPGDPVQVIGKVERFNLAEITRQIASPVNNAALAMWAGKPSVIATSVDAFRPPVPGVGE